MAKHPVPVFFLCCLGIASALAGPGRAAYAQTTDACAPESAGNDAPAQALAVGSAFCIEGGLAKRQHLFAWTVPDATPGQAWSIMLDGGTGQDASLLFRRLEPTPGAAPAGKSVV